MGATRDDPAVRLGLLERTYLGPYGRAPQHLPFRRAALSFRILSPSGGVLGDPRLGGTGVFLSPGRVLPGRYPAPLGVGAYISRENRLGRLLDYGVIVSRMDLLYEWSALELHQPDMLQLIEDGAPVYAWPYAARHVWRTAHPSVAVRLLRHTTSPRHHRRRGDWLPVSPDDPGALLRTGDTRRVSGVCCCASLAEATFQKRAHGGAGR